MKENHAELRIVLRDLAVSEFLRKNLKSLALTNKSDGKRSSIALSSFQRRKNGDESITDNFYFTPDQEAYYEMKNKIDKPAKINRPRITDWKIIKQIGQGSFGKVYYVFDTEAGRPMAMKQLVLPDDNERNRKKLNDLQMEIEFLTKLNHDKMWVTWLINNIVLNTLDVRKIKNSSIYF